MRGDLAAFGLLRGHVFGGADQAAVGGQPHVAKQPGDAEVGELDVPFGREEQVCRFEVAVNDAVVVGVLRAPWRA